MLTTLQMLLATSFVQTEDSENSQKDSTESEKPMNQEVPKEKRTEAESLTKSDINSGGS